MKMDLFDKDAGIIHIVGIGGAGMSAIAKVLIERGYKIQGSDIKKSRYIANLCSLGIKVFIGHRKENIEGAKLVVYSTAINFDNPEIAEARKRGIPVMHRSEMLRHIVNLNKLLAVTGTHGKTTTTSLAAFLLSRAGLAPGFIVGGELNEIGTNAQHGEGDFFVLEADESDGSFLAVDPQFAIVTNVENDHIEHYGSFNKIISSFREFIEKTKEACILCLDCSTLAGLAEEQKLKGKRIITYSLSKETDVMAKDIEVNFERTTFTITDRLSGKELRATMKLKGKHNVQNALSIYALGKLLSIDEEIILGAIRDFSGVARRFEVVGTVDGKVIIDDYAHHPTEIKATIEAVRDTSFKRIIAVFQPHRYSRVANLFDEFTEAFDGADVVVSTQIYASSEEPIPGVSGQRLFESIANVNRKKKLAYIPKLLDIPAYVSKIARSGDAILFLGAGDINLVAPETLNALIDEKERV